MEISAEFLQKTIDMGIEQRDLKRTIEEHKLWLTEIKAELKVFSQISSDMKWIINEWKDHLKTSDNFRGVVIKNEQSLKDLIGRLDQNGVSSKWRATFTLRMISLVVSLSGLSAAGVYFLLNFIFK